MLQGDAASPIRPPCTDSSRLTETRGVRNHPDPVNGASGPAPSNAPQPSTAAASSCAATGARRLEALRDFEARHRWHLRHGDGALRRRSRLAGPTRGNQAGCRERRVRLCGVCLTWMGSAAVLEGARAGEASGRSSPR